MESDNFTRHYIIRYLSGHELVLPLSLQCKQGGVIHTCSVHCNQASFIQLSVSAWKLISTCYYWTLNGGLIYPDREVWPARWRPSGLGHWHTAATHRLPGDCPTAFCRVLPLIGCAGCMINAQTGWHRYRVHQARVWAYDVGWWTLSRMKNAVHRETHHCDTVSCDILWNNRWQCMARRVWRCASDWTEWVRERRVWRCAADWTEWARMPISPARMHSFNKSLTINLRAHLRA